MELRARVTAARRQIMGEMTTNEFPPNRLTRRWGRFDAPLREAEAELQLVVEDFCHWLITGPLRHRMASYTRKLHICGESPLCDDR
jgi:hypothetical protein